MKVLVVDDSEVIRERIALTLSVLEGVELAGEAGDAETAVELNRLIDPDTIILDMRLSPGSGIEVLKRVKEEAGAPVVIVFTGYSLPQYRQRCMDSGADFFLNKSEDFERIPEILSGLVCGHATRGG